MEAASVTNTDNKFNIRSHLRNYSFSDFSDENLDNIRFVEINSLPAVREHLTPKL